VVAGAKRWSLAVLLLLITQSISFAQTKFADVSSALNVTALQPGKTAVIAIVLDVKEGFHAQSHTPLDENLIACRVVPDSTPAIESLDPIYPAGKEENYPALGKVSVYTGKTIIYIPIKVKADAPLGAITISGVARYPSLQRSTLLRPSENSFQDRNDRLVGHCRGHPANPELFKDYSDKPTTAPTTAPAAQMTTPPGGDGSPQWSIFTALGVAFLAGLLFNDEPEHEALLRDVARLP